MGKYLVALSLSFGDATKKGPGPGSLTTKKGPSPRRRRLHVLYVLNDLFHHVRRDGQGRGGEEVVTSSLQPFLVQLFAAAASFEKCPKHQEKIQVLLGIWEENGYFGVGFIEELRDAVEDAKKSGGAVTLVKDGTVAEPGKGERKDVTAGDAPFMMPSLHGDPATSYYDLPAGNLMPHIYPDGNHPINPQLVKPLQLAPGPADGELVNAVKKFLQDVDRLFGGGRGIGGEDNGVFADIDELGQPLLSDEVTGELSGGDTYYGWSRSFCEKMKARKRRRGSEGDYRGRSDSRARSVTPQKRRRYSNSRSSSRGRWGSPSRSPSRFDRGRDFNARSHRSRSRSRSGSLPDYPRRRERGRSRTRSPAGFRSPPYSPRDGGLAVPQPIQNGMAHAPSQYSGGFPIPGAPLPSHPMPDPALLAQIMAQASRMMPGGVPVPPPPPSLLPNGQWLQHPPPPPPQAFPSNGMFNPQGAAYPHHPGMPIPPPPPPPPPSNAPSAQQSYGGPSQGSSHSVGPWR